MKRLLLPLLMIVVCGMLINGHQVGHACTVDPGPNFDPVKSADIIVSGRFVGWEPQMGDKRDPSAEAVPVIIQMDVDHVYKGPTRSSLRILERGSLYTASGNGNYVWGGRGMCESFEDDPIGAYALVGVNKLEDGNVSHTYWFFYGEQPAGGNYDRAVHLVTPHDFPLLPAAALAVIGPLAFLAGAAFLWRPSRASG